MTDADKQRLERFAPLFGVGFVQCESGYELRPNSDSSELVLVLPAPAAHLRLLTELCGKCVNWVYFRGQEHCGKTFLSLPDAKILRIAQLYALRQKNEVADSDEESTAV